MKVVNIITDTSPLDCALKELEELVISKKVSTKDINEFFDNVCCYGLICFEDSIEINSRDIVIVVKPSDKLIKFTSERRTRKV